MRSAMPRSLNEPSASGMSISPRISAAIAAMPARRSRFPAREPMRDAQKRGHQKARASGKSSSAAKCGSPSAISSRAGIGRQFVGEALGEFADGGVDDGAALGGARLGIDRIERPQAQNVLGVDRIGVAQPMLDLGDRKTFRPRRRAAASARAAAPARPAPADRARAPRRDNYRRDRRPPATARRRRRRGAG